MIAGASAVAARQRLPDLLRGGIWPPREEILRGEQHAGRTEAALERVLDREGLLQVTRLAGGRHPLDGLDATAVTLYGEHEAAAHDGSVHAHRARAAYPVLATHVRAGQLELVAEEVHQALPWLDATADRCAIDGEQDRDGIVPATARPSCG